MIDDIHSVELPLEELSIAEVSTDDLDAVLLIDGESIEQSGNVAAIAYKTANVHVGLQECIDQAATEKPGAPGHKSGH
jgi:hypothetical protein